MEASLSTDQAVWQAELNRLRAEAAAAEARLALARAEAELARAAGTAQSPAELVSPAAASPPRAAAGAPPAQTTLELLRRVQQPAGTAAPPASPPGMAAPAPWSPSASNGHGPEGAHPGPAPGSASLAPTPAPPVVAPPPVMAATASLEAASRSAAADPAGRLHWWSWKSRAAPSAAPAASDTAADAERQHWLHQGLLWATTAYGSSIVLHMLLIIALGLWYLPQLMKPSATELVAAIVERPEEMISQFLERDTTPTNELALVSSSMASIEGALGEAPSLSEPRTQTEVVDTPTDVKVDVGELNVFKSDGRRMSMELPEGSFGDPQQVVADYDDAMDRITQEILARLAKGKVLVIWCLDESESMKDDLQEIRDRIDRVYYELGLSESTKNNALLTAVASYGKDTHFHTPQPTSDVDKIRAAMDAVPNDPSGLEMQCQAVGQVINTYRRFAASDRRQLMLIMVTDESGDPDSNVQYLEATIAEAKSARCPIYVLGREAVFGYPYAHMVTPVTVPAVGGGTVTRTFVLPIDRGPETANVEQLQTDGFKARQDAHPSGFGAYEQCRMARQTGGIMFLLPSPEVRLFERDDRKYALDSMRPYLPDLSSRNDYITERDKHPLRATLWKVISDLNPYKPEIARHINLRLRFSNQPSTFATQVRAEQEKAKQFVLYLDAAEKALEGLQTARAREASPRWEANYDLIYAQVLAYKVRVYEYGAYLEEFVKNPKQPDPPKPDRVLAYWEIRTRKETITGSLTRAYIERSREKFEETMRLHDGTPWAARAEIELRRGFGVELFPVYHNPLAVGRQPVRPIVPPKL